ncbi:MAG: hypothetical protein GX286_07015 [Clostridiales bacterium]|jgi:hypothetical protein|nr:hypothetical protein [Clostridiales bacterium]
MKKVMVRTMKKVMVLLLFAFALCSLTSCGVENSFNTESSTETDSSSEVMTLNDDSILISIIAYTPKYDNYNVLYVSANGTVSCGIFISHETSHEFLLKWQTNDKSIWDSLKDITEMGNITSEDLIEIKKSILSVDLNSDYYHRSEEDAFPDVEDRISYIINCYKWEDGNTDKVFRVISYGESTGTSYKTYDENALKAYAILENSDFIVQWKDNIEQQLIFN